MSALTWNNLLSTKRVRELDGGDSSEHHPADVRTEFDRDYGRAIFSTPVRRLQDKAQVFPLEPNDSVRTRLTHSLEVSSIARGLGTLAETFLRDKRRERGIAPGTISTIAATCALIHDIGNPPFGHAGEKAIGSWFENRKELFASFPGSNSQEKLESQYAQDFLRFEGNAQTQRLLSSLQILADKYGLNMTCATLSASLKYVVASNEVSPTKAETKKHGYFASESDLIKKVKAEVGTGDARNPIAFLVEAADDIAYSTVDLEDGIKKGCLDWQTFESELTNGADGEITSAILEATRKKILPAKLPRKAHDEAMSIAFRTNAIFEMTKAAGLSFETNYDAIMSGKCATSLLNGSSVSTLVSTCKKIAGKYVYSSPSTLKLELMGRKIIWDLLSLFWEAAEHIGSAAKFPPFAERCYALLSENYRNVCTDNVQSSKKHTAVPTDYYRMQLITDQVCGMTDTFAVNLHRELTNG
jgi:dGTPase